MISRITSIPQIRLIHKQLRDIFRTLAARFSYRQAQYLSSNSRLVRLELDEKTPDSHRR